MRSAAHSQKWLRHGIVDQIGIVDQGVKQVKAGGRGFHHREHRDHRGRGRARGMVGKKASQGALFSAKKEGANFAPSLTKETVQADGYRKESPWYLAMTTAKSARHPWSTQIPRRFVPQL
jgi:hypothetical protein